MSEIQPEAQTEPDPSATSIGNDQTLNPVASQDATSSLSAAPTSSDYAAKAEQMTAEAAEQNGTNAGAADKIAELADKGNVNGNSAEETSKDGKVLQGQADSSTLDNDDKEGSNGVQRSPTNKRNNRGENDRYTKKPRLNKSTYEDLPESNDADEIRRQVEFYFSDSNLPTDKYLLTKTGGSENNPFPLKEIHNFKRMRHFQPFSAVLAAVKSSETLDVTDDGMITRVNPLSTDFTDDIDQNRKIHQDRTMDRSIYAKGFGDETEKSQLEIEDFFAPHGTINSVRLRRANDGWFKGSVFVEFETPEMAKEFLELEAKPKWNGETELKFMSKRVYTDGKVEAIREGKVRPNSPRRDERRGGFNKRGGGGGNRSRGGFNDRGSRGRGKRGRGGGDRGRNNERRRTGRDDQGEDGSGDTAEAVSKKRAHEDGGERQGEAEAKKLKADDAAAE